jgi:hypothetical protein
VDGEQEDKDMELSGDEIGDNEDNATEGNNGVKSNESDRDDNSEGNLTVMTTVRALGFLMIFCQTEILSKHLEK